MSGTKSFPADNVKLHISSAADAPTGTMTVLMRTNRYYTDGSLLQTGEEYTVTKEWGQDALSRNWCEDVADVFPETETPSGLTAAETAATKALVSGDRTPVASSRDITADDNGKFLTPSGTLTLTIPAGLDPMPSFTVDCPASGTVSIARSTTATINGAGTTLTRTRANNPVGFVVLAHESDAYGVSGG